MSELKDDKLAKHLLNGSNCNQCRYGDGMMCRLFEPIKVKYPDDVQVFVNGLLQFDGYDAVNNVVIMLEGKVHLNQFNPSATSNSTSFQLCGGETIQVYSRGIDVDGNYECQRFAREFTLVPYPQEAFCAHFRSK